MTPRSLKTSLCYKYITKNFKRPDTKRNFKSRPKQHRQLSRNPKDNLFVTRSLVDTDSFDLAKQVQVSLSLSLSLSRSVCSIRAATNHRPSPASCNHGKDWQPCYRDRDSTVPFILEPVRGRLNISRQRSTDTLTGDKAKYGSGRSSSKPRRISSCIERRQYTTTYTYLQAIRDPLNPWLLGVE